MSDIAPGQTGNVLRLCRSCLARHAQFGDHEGPGIVCLACFRAERDRRRAEAVATMPSGGLNSMPFHAAVTLTTRGRAHRRRMLDHLASVEG